MSDKNMTDARKLVRDSSIQMTLKILGKHRRADAEWLAERVLEHWDKIRESAAGIATGPFPDAELAASVQQQFQEHSEEIVETAMNALGIFQSQVLTAAVRRSSRK